MKKTVTIRKMYLAFDVGCIECGEESSVVGVFKTIEEAEKAIDDYLDDPGTTWGKKGWTGQHSVEVFDVEVPL